MNIFVTDTCPIQSALNLPDKHIVKMPLETCQMLAIIYSDWYYGIGKLHKKDGTPYRTEHGAFRKHPCTIWAAANQYNLAWLIAHGYALCAEYHSRYDKVHTCYSAICEAADIYDRTFDEKCGDVYHKVTDFTRAMPDDIKFDKTIDTITAYKRYLNTKPWLATNYLRIPSRKPSFIKTTMTTSNVNDLPVYDFSNDKPATEQYPEPKIAEKDILKDAIAKAEAAMAAKSAKKSLVPAKKAPKKTGKAGRIVGISADENKFLQELFAKLLSDSNYATMTSSEAFKKIEARYNK